MIIAQISDPHITSQDNGDAQGETAATHLQRAVAYLLALPAQPDVVLVTGDCVDTGQSDEYARFQDVLRPLSMPVYVVPGNHDNREHMRACFGAQGTQPLAGFVQYVVDTGAVRLIALDTHVPGANNGYLCAERLHWLEERLAEALTRPTLIFMHHPPISVGMAVLDGMSLGNADAFEAIIARHPQVERIVAGHVHMALVRRFAGTIVMTCSATAHTMLPDLSRPERLAVLIEPPVCLMHVWRDRPALVTYTGLIDAPSPIIELHDGTHWLQ